MTLEPSLHKQRGDFSHNYKKIRIKCPECIRIIKGRNHVKAYKNLAGLWRHIKLEHGDISNLEFNTHQIKEILRHIAQAIELGMLSNTSEINYDTASSLSILYDGRLPRKEVMNKLKEIAELLKIQSELYPFFKTEQLTTRISVIIGHVDKRTMKKYFECITNYSNKNWENGTYDVTAFCKKF